MGKSLPTSRGKALDSQADNRAVISRDRSPENSQGTSLAARQTSRTPKGVVRTPNPARTVPGGKWTSLEGTRPTRTN